VKKVFAINPPEADTKERREDRRFSPRSSRIAPEADKEHEGKRRRNRGLVEGGRFYSMIVYDSTL